VYETAKELKRHLAVPIPNEHTDVYERVAKKLGVHLQTGTFLEVDDRFPSCVFNTTCPSGRPAS
jgi:hypothetical protein